MQKRLVAVVLTLIMILGAVVVETISASKSEAKEISSNSATVEIEPPPIVADMEIQDIYAIIEETYGFSSDLISAIIIVESKGNPDCVSATNDLGLMQIHQPYWDYYYNQTKEIFKELILENDPFNPQVNILVGATALAGWQQYTTKIGDNTEYAFLNYYNQGYHPTNDNYRLKVLSYIAGTEK